MTDIFSDPEMSELMRKAAEAHRRIFSNLAPDKVEAVRLMMTAFTWARNAYCMATGVGYVANTETAGDMAYCYCMTFAAIRWQLGASMSDAEVLGKMQRTSEWLKEKGWSGIPEVTFDGNRVVFKTAVQMHDDMLYYRRETNRIRQERDARRKSASAK